MIFKAENGMSLAESNHLLIETMDIAVLFQVVPVQPSDFVILAISIVVAELCISHLVSGENHRHTLTYHQKRHGILNLLMTKEVDARVGGLAFPATVPTIVVVFAIIFNGQKARWWVMPGVLISFAGVVMVLGGEQGFNAAEVLEHIRLNPWSYLLALLGALTWAVYSNLTRAWSGGQNPTLIIFSLDFIIFSSLWAAGYGDLSRATLHGCLSVAIGAAAMGGAYAAWSYGVTKGNITILGVASYFTPILSCLFASIWIGAELDAGFWTGVAVVVFGSLLCWSSTYLRR